MGHYRSLLGLVAVGASLLVELPDYLATVESEDRDREVY
jgi:hypothetical protein